MMEVLSSLATTTRFPAIEKALVGKRSVIKSILSLNLKTPLRVRSSLDYGCSKCLIGRPYRRRHEGCGHSVGSDWTRIFIQFLDWLAPRNHSDGNHPLAGEALTIDIEIFEINKPTKEEIENIESQAASSDLFEISEVPEISFLALKIQFLIQAIARKFEKFSSFNLRAKFVLSAYPVPIAFLSSSLTKLQTFAFSPPSFSHQTIFCQKVGFSISN